MRIALVAPPWVPVPPTSYGGTEQVIDALARGLAAQGHEVVLATVGESACPVDRRSHFDRVPGRMNSTEGDIVHAVAAYEQLPDVDVVHDHTTVGPFVAAVHRPELPVVTTNHGMFTRETRLLYRAIARHADVVAISHDQRSRSGAVPVATVIHHGLDLDHFPVGGGRGDYLLFVGRMSPDKGAHRAVTIARRSGMRLRIAAKMRDATEIEYFEQQVRPGLGRGVEFVGEVGPGDRAQLMGDALALLNPIRWPEPFGLTVIETSACGTPVISFAEGAATETVRHGVTGFLVDDEDEAVRAVERLATIDRGACRAWVEERFSVDRMVAEHLRAYADAMARHRAADRTPRRPAARAGV